METINNPDGSMTLNIPKEERFVLVTTLDGATALLTETTLRAIRKSPDLRSLDAPAYTISADEALKRGLLEPAPPQMPASTPVGRHGSFGKVPGSD